MKIEEVILLMFSLLQFSTFYKGNKQKEQPRPHSPQLERLTLTLQ